MKKFTEDEKLKIWLDYMVTTVALNNVPVEINYREGLIGDFNHYPMFGISTFKLQTKHKIKTFESFCNDNNELASENLYGWYWRFKDRIFK
jgi:hypothetical protein